MSIFDFLFLSKEEKEARGKGYRISEMLDGSFKLKFWVHKNPIDNYSLGDEYHWWTYPLLGHESLNLEQVIKTKDEYFESRRANYKKCKVKKIIKL